MLTVYFCDDNHILLKKYEEMVMDICKQKNIPVSTRLFISGEQLLFQIEDNPNDADIIYLDIRMGRTNGIEAAMQLRNLGCNAEIIFLTVYEEYVFESFDTSPLYYIVKDKITIQKFCQIFLHGVSLSEERERQFFSCECNGVSKNIPIHKISYFEIHNRTVTVNFSDGQFEFYATMEKLEQKLSSKGFCRCHRSFLVSLKYIWELRKNELQTIDGQIIPIGLTYARNLKVAYSAFLVEF